MDARPPDADAVGASPQRTKAGSVWQWLSRDWHLTFAVSVAILGAGWLVWLFIVMPRNGGWGYDFQAYYLAARRLVVLDTLYQSVTLSAPYRPGPWGLYLYPPPLGVALLPAARASLGDATAAWYGIHVAALVTACAIMPVRPHVRMMVFAAGAFSTAVWSDLALGNVSLLLVLPITVLWRWLDRPLGSIGLAVAMSVRPTFALYLVWWALRRRFMAIAWTIVAGMIIVAFSLPFVGVDGYRQYLVVLGHVTDVMGVPHNKDLGTMALGVGWSPIAASALLFAGYALGGAAILLSLRRDREVGFMVTLGASLLLSPLLWDHYLVLALLPAAFLAQRWRWWAAALPLLAWVTGFQVIVALAMTVLPFLARPTETLGSAPPSVDPSARSVTVLAGDAA